MWPILPWLRRAVRLCKDVQILPPHPDRYEQAMRDVLKRALPYSPLIETGEDDGHLFMDATGTGRLFGPPKDVAWRLRRQIKSDLDLDPIWSVAPNKLVAKVATRLVKPDGEYIVAPGERCWLRCRSVWFRASSTLISCGCGNLT
jgi:DNA polymerase-4